MLSFLLSRSMVRGTLVVFRFWIPIFQYSSLRYRFYSIPMVNHRQSTCTRQQQTFSIPFLFLSRRRRFPHLQYSRSSATTTTDVFSSKRGARPKGPQSLNDWWNAGIIPPKQGLVSYNSKTCNESRWIWNQEVMRTKISYPRIYRRCYKVDHSSHTTWTLSFYPYLYRTHHTYPYSNLNLSWHYLLIITFTLLVILLLLSLTLILPLF